MTNPLDTPRFSNYFEDPNSAINLLDDRQLLFLHNRQGDRSYPSDGPESYVTSAVKVSESPETVRETILDFQNWSNLIEFVNEAQVTEESNDEFTVSFELGLTMGIINPTFQYELEYRVCDNGDLVWSQKSGDLSAHQGRWEFVELADNETLLVYTLYTDFSGSGFMVNTVLWAQPDLKVAMPITLAGIYMNCFWNHLRSNDSDTRTMDNPRIPQLSSMDEESLDLFGDLTDSGIPMVLHPTQSIEAKAGPVDLLFTSAGAKLPTSYDVAKEHLTEFERYPEFIEQVHTVDLRKTPDEFNSTWTFKLGFGVLSMTIKFDIEYEWIDDHTLELTLTSGDFEKIFGHLEWIPLGDDESIYMVTTASVIGPDAPSLVKLANLVPHRQVFMGTTLGTVVLQKSSEWLESILNQ